MQGLASSLNLAGDDFSAQTANEFIVDTAVPSGNGNSEPLIAPVLKEAGLPRELTPEERFQQTLAVQWPTKKHAGKTLGDVLHVEPSALTWLADRYSGNPEASKAAKFICEYASQVTTS